MNRLPVCATLLLVFIAFGATASNASQSRTRPAGTDEARWLDRLDHLDRALLNELIGFAPPAFTDDLTWIGREPASWDDLRGKVVLVQSWSHRSTAGRRMPARVDAALKDVNTADIDVLLLHVPEGNDTLTKFLDRQTPANPVIFDSSGEFCDALGMYKKPVNMLIDRNGTVRYAGLNSRGLPLAIEKLIAEEHDPEATPKKPEAAPAVKTVEYPEFTGSVKHARDLRGQRAPDLMVEEWLNGRPNGTGKVMIVDFWATWCGPCIRSIPHMNELATSFSRDVVIVGISDESLANFNNGIEKLRNRDIRLETFRYAVALDSNARMKNAARVTGIPHALVMSSDWIVRWQGHPSTLTAKTLEQIVNANAQSTPTSSTPLPRKRWTR